MDKKIKEYHKIYKILEDKLDSMYDEDADIQSEEYLELEKQFIDFVRNDYAKVVFEVYYKKNPKIKDTYSGETKRWNDVFGPDFDKISTCFREGLVGLIEGYGAYKLK